jgi:hypothetical protein
MGMVPSYKTNEWQVTERRGTGPTGGSNSSIQIRVKEGDEWRDYSVPKDPGNSDYALYNEWLDDGNEPKIIFT